jgi:hypothetical protein
VDLDIINDLDVFGSYTARVSHRTLGFTKAPVTLSPDSFQCT